MRKKQARIRKHEANTRGKSKGIVGDRGYPKGAAHEDFRGVIISKARLPEFYPGQAR